MKELYNHWDEVRLNFRGGKLWKRDGWRNVIEHQAVQLYGAKVLGDLLKLSYEDVKKLESIALVHDWEKRFNKHPEDFSSEEIDQIKVFVNKVDPDIKLMSATGPSFLEKVLYTGVSELELFQFYLDDITRGKEIVTFDERIDEVSVRRHDLDNDVELTKRLNGKKYWDLEREIGHEVEKVLFNRLVDNGVNITSPNKIPDLIRSKIIEQTNG